MKSEKVYVVCDYSAMPVAVYRQQRAAIRHVKKYHTRGQKWHRQQNKDLLIYLDPQGEEIARIEKFDLL